MSFKKLVSEEDWDITPKSIKKIAEEMLINYEKEVPDSIDGWELSYKKDNVPEKFVNMKRLTPGPIKDWENTPESVQEMVMKLTVDTMKKMR